MVNHNHYRVKASRWGKISDEVHRQLFEREGNGGRDRTKQWGRRMSVHFILLTDNAASDKMFHKSGQPRLPKILFQDSLGVENTHMT